jgi:IS30 family transposase
MANPNRSADAAYYASRQPLKLRGTREGRKNPSTPASYVQRSSDAASSSDKYYAAKASKSPEKVVQKKTVTIEATPRFITKVVSAFKAGATHVVISVQATELAKARASVDMAVGRNKLSRQQADVVFFDVVKSPEPAPEPLQEKPKKKRGRKKKVEPVIDEAQTILEEVKSPEEVLPAPAEEVEQEITEDDVAKAFGVDLDADDDSDD